MTAASAVEKIKQVLRAHELFLRTDLRLTDITEMMHTNRTYLWQALKDEGTTFSEIVNKMRIEYAVKLIRQHPDVPISEICASSGYANLESFYRHFRNVMHYTPREYAKRLKEEWR